MDKENLFDLTGKVALITGASSGLGKHFAKTLSSYGAKTILAARRIERMESLQKELLNESIVISLDVTSNESVNKLKEEIQNSTGQLDILVNNAGISDPVKFKDISEESWLSILDTNLNGAFRVAKMATDIMLKNKNGGTKAAIYHQLIFSAPLQGLPLYLTPRKNEITYYSKRDSNQQQ